MSMRISEEEYNKLELYFAAYTSEQWLENGVCITFELEYDEDYYYLHCYPHGDREEYEKCDTCLKDKPVEYCEECCADLFDEAYLFCNDFGYRKCIDLDDVNDLIKDELPKQCLFTEGEDGEIYGW